MKNGERSRNAYDIFILALTVLSLVFMAGLLLPLSPETESLLLIYDTLICLVFLGDFALQWHRAPRKRDYFIGQRGWLDLLGSIPTVGAFSYAAVLRLARLSRLARISRLLRGQNKRDLIRDVLQHRGQYAVFITMLGAILVLSLSSVFVLQFESASPDSNIHTPGGALWWAIVTITTVGYGDEYPVTPGGRITAVFVMLAGIGIIGSLASIFASILMPQTPPEGAAPTADLRTELVAVREELAALRRSVEGAGPKG